jgi:ACT domain-containing protein
MLQQSYQLANTHCEGALKMAKADKEITEIIELATADIDALARAFNLIAEVCENRENPEIQLPLASTLNLLN